MSNQLQENLDIILKEKQKKITPENLKLGVTCFGIKGTLVNRVAQSKVITIGVNGLYNVKPDSEYNSLSEVTIEALVSESGDEQHMPFYWLEVGEDDDYLWCVNNYETIQYVPYSLDVDGNLILIQDDSDSVIYSINEDMELEVEIHG